MSTKTGKVLFAKTTYGRYEFVVPASGKYKLECWGAAGGLGYGGANPFGLGGYACGEVKLTKGETIYIYVGEDGVNANTTPSFNGGGSAYATSGHNGGRGGGASDIRRGADNFNSRIIVAGGGGGAQSTCGGVGTTAGHGGGLTGITSINQTGTGYRGSYATGGTQTAGGTAHNNSGQPVIHGSFGVGANSQTCGAGGGGGWYGGGSTYTAGGGGGSSYIGTLENALTIDGASVQPSISGGTQTGNSGNGGVKITLFTITTYHYALYNVDEDKYYIPNKNFYDFINNKFIPVTIDYLKDQKSNAYKFMYDINDMFKRMYINSNKNFIPIQQLYTPQTKIIKISIYDETFNNPVLSNNEVLNSKVFDPSKIHIKYNISCDNINNSIIKVEGFIQDDNYSYRFVDIGNINSAKVLIKWHDDFYGKDLKKTSLYQILIDGIDGNELNRYELDFISFDLYAAFKNRVIANTDMVKSISFHTKEFQSMKRLTDVDIKVFYDKEEDMIYIRFNKGFTNALVKKLENTEIQYDESMETF